jgi:hypothetical protein
MQICFNFWGGCRAGSDRGYDEATKKKRKREEKKIAIKLLETASQFNPFSLATANP